MRSQGLGCLHIREADLPGPTDLLVWEDRTILGWIELKIEGGQLRASQIEFIRERTSERENVYVFSFDIQDGDIAICRGLTMLPFEIVPFNKAHWPTLLREWAWRTP